MRECQQAWQRANVDAASVAERIDRAVPARALQRVQRLVNVRRIDEQRTQTNEQQGDRQVVQQGLERTLWVEAVGIKVRRYDRLLRCGMQESM